MPSSGSPNEEKLRPRTSISLAVAIENCEFKIENSSQAPSPKPFRYATLSRSTGWGSLMRFRTSFVFVTVFLLAASFSTAGESVDHDAITKIRNQGFRHSQVMDIAWHLTEGVGPRLTGSPQELEAHQWAKAKFEEWGLTARLEDYDFGRSWRVETAQVRLVAPYVQPLEALPGGLDPGNRGAGAGQSRSRGSRVRGRSGEMGRQT